MISAPLPVEALPDIAPEEDPVEDSSDMEGVEREGLFASRHAPGLDEPTPTAMEAPRPEEKKKKGKGKGKEVQVALPASESGLRKQKGSSRQLQQQRAADEARAQAAAAPEVAGTKADKGKEEEVRIAVSEASTRPARKPRAEVGGTRTERAAATTPETALVPGTILKRPETIKREEDERKERLARKTAARAKWESGDLEKWEWEAYSKAANPILALEAGDDEAEKAARAVAHMAGMRAVETLWEERQGQQKERPPQGYHQRPKQSGPQQQQQLRSQQQGHRSRVSSSSRQAGRRRRLRRRPSRSGTLSASAATVRWSETPRDSNPLSARFHGTSGRSASREQPAPLRLTRRWRPRQRRKSTSRLARLRRLTSARRPARSRRREGSPRRRGRERR